MWMDLVISHVVYAIVKWTSTGKTEASVYQQAEDGKTELSLMHFAITNPGWQPPRESTVLISLLKERVQRDSGSALALHTMLPDNPLFSSNQSEYEPQSLIANIIAGPSSLAHCGGRNLQTSRPLPAVSEVVSALRSFSSTQSSQQATDHLMRRPYACSPSTTLGSGMDARTASSGSSAWEGQLQSMIFSEYGSNEMSLHALYLHQAHQRHTRMEPERHVWHRDDSDESADSVQENTQSSIPRSASYPLPSVHPATEESSALQSGFQRRYGGITDPGTEHRAPASFSPQPMGGWAEEGQAETVQEEGPEDERLPPVHKV
ncbi:autophagy-related protein 9A-like [Rhinatrema bivittatum]|uniref:autophagy-related protein 9A-like n=1 Tax=Rhinatrema bivittatum TaxID=194408 RepID=UPI001126C33E|nr:autophagy-related protein 9A-like [Rhinatrema bivittatum]